MRLLNHFKTNLMEELQILEFDRNTQYQRFSKIILNILQNYRDTLELTSKETK